MPDQVRIAALAILVSGIPTVLSAADNDATEKPESDRRADNARMVLAAIVKSAAVNQILPDPEQPGARPPFFQTDDALTEHYVCIAAAAARRLPETEAAPAFLLALGIALDDSPLLRDNLLTGSLWRKVESNAARKRRLTVLGVPTLYGRHDLAQHFAVSAALTALSGRAAAESAGVFKEMMDSRGGTGFSFADLSADFAGIALADRLLDKPARLAEIEKGFRIRAYAISPRGLPEGMSAEQFARKFGSIKDERYLRLQDDIRKRIARLPGYRD